MGELNDDQPADPSGSLVTRSAILSPKQHDKSTRCMNALATSDPLADLMAV